MPIKNLSLLSSPSRVQVPWVKVTIGNYTFGAFDYKTREQAKTNSGFYTAYDIQYPNYIQSLQIKKINGQINTYTLNISYPVTADDDPNFFEKIFSSVSTKGYDGTSKTARRILFSYGDASMPNYLYKNEEAIITSVTQGFSFGNDGTMNSVITYQIQAQSAGILAGSNCSTFNYGGIRKPSDIIKELLKTNAGGINNLFTGMNASNIDKLIEGGDKAVELVPKFNISVLDYLNYLVSSMIPDSTKTSNISTDIYILTIHDTAISEKTSKAPDMVDGEEMTGPYFKVSRTSYIGEHTDAYTIDLGTSTSAIVTSFQVNNNDSYSLFYDYQESLSNEQNHYVRRLDDKGRWIDEYAPNISSDNDQRKTYSEDTSWWTKITKYPISATVTVQGLLRPATLLSYVRLNVIFPGGRKHISSGLYIVTEQTDQLNTSGYRTQLTMTRINN